MSCCLIIQDKDNIFVGVDSAISDGEGNRKSDYGKKFFKFGEVGLFCSGDIAEVDRIINYLEAQEDVEVETISNFVQEFKPQSTEILIFHSNSIYQISPYEDFKLIKHPKIKDGINVLCAGFKVNEAVTIASNILAVTKDIGTVMMETFNKIQCSEIGGKISIYHITNKVRYINGGWLKKNQEHFILADVIGGKLIIGNQLMIEASKEDGTGVFFRVDENGVYMKNADIVLTSDDGVDQTVQQMIDGVDSKVSSDLNEAIDKINTSIGTIEEGIIETFYQSTTPKGKDGDIWFNTSNGLAYRYDGSRWQSIQDKDVIAALEKAQSAQTTADGKIVSYYQRTTPSEGSEGDLWIDIGNGNKLYRYTNGKWASVQDASIIGVNLINNSLPNRNDTRCWRFSQGTGNYYQEYQQRSYLFLNRASGTKTITSNYYSVRPDTEYTLSFMAARGGGFGTCNIRGYNEKGDVTTTGTTSSGILRSVSISEDENVITFTTGKSTQSVFIQFTSTSTSGEIELWNIKLELGSSNTPYSISPTESNFFESLKLSEMVTGAINSDGTINTDKLIGSIQAGKNNIILGTGRNSMKLNENGILITKNGGASYDTAISAEGIVADAIKAGGMIQGVQLKVGESDTRFMQINARGIISGYIDGTETFRLSHNSQGTLMLYSPSNGTRATLNSSYSWNLDPNGRTYQGCGLSTSGRDGLAIASNVYILGNYTATGAKNAVVPTENYGARLLYSEESDKVYFNTYGKSETVSNTVTIEIDKVFLETIELNSECPYIISLTPYNDARIWVESVTDNEFVVRSDKDTKFDYGIRCIRKGYKNTCLEEA